VPRADEATGLRSVLDGTGQRNIEIHKVVVSDSQRVAQALIWAMMAAARHRHTHGYRTRIGTEFERALAIVQRGLG
jgi:hypothetical protein